MRRIRKQEIVFKLDAKERHELQTQTMISTTGNGCVDTIIESLILAQDERWRRA